MLFFSPPHLIWPHTFLLKILEDFLHLLLVSGVGVKKLNANLISIFPPFMKITKFLRICYRLISIFDCARSL